MERANRDSFVAFDNITNQAISLEMTLHRETELCKKLQKVLQGVIEEIINNQDNIKVQQKNIKTAIERQRLVGNNLDSLNDSLTLMEKVRCDYKNQLILEKIKTEEQKINLDSIIQKYECIWQKYEKIYFTFPMASERELLQKEVNELRSSYLKKKQLLIQEERKLEQMKHIRCVQMQVKIIQFCKIYMQHSSTAELYSSLQEEFRRLEVEIKKLSMESAKETVKLPENKNYDISFNKPINHSETMNDVLTNRKDFFAASSTLAKEPILQKSVTKSQYEDIQLATYDVLEIPQLKLPLFNSPPRKQWHSSQSILTQVNFICASELQTKATNHLMVKESRSSNAGCPLRNEMNSAITDEHHYEKMDEDNAETLEELEKVSETEKIQHCGIQKPTELNESMKEITHSQESNPSSGGSDDDFNSEKYRQSYINQLKQAPEFSYFPRENVRNSKQVETSSRVDDLRSQYFVKTYARTEVAQEGDQESNNEVEMDNDLQVPENDTNRESTYNISTDTAQKDSSVNYDLQLVQFDSPSPPAYEVGHSDVLYTTSLDQSSDSQGNGFTLNFAPQRSNNIISLFGNAAEQSSEQDESKNDSFNFTFGNQTKPSNVFKLF